SHGLKLELEGVFNAVCLELSHVVSLRLLRHLARDTFFRGKVKARTEQTEVPIFDLLQVWDESGNPVMVEEEFVAGSHEELNENQEVRTVLDYATRQMQLTTKVPRMEVVEEPVYEQAVYQREGGRVHLGISAQELRAQLLAHGIDDCAAWCLADPEDPESTQSVREAQLIPVLLKAVAELASEVETLRSFAAVGSNAN
ncbi:hypothetical protein RGM3321_00250, partial [Pseudomonas sp. RGM3321]|nr:hypothetical protein [Pseudomonas sp. RGM 3321]